MTITIAVAQLHIVCPAPGRAGLPVGLPGAESPEIADLWQRLRNSVDPQVRERIDIQSRLATSAAIEAQAQRVVQVARFAFDRGVDVLVLPMDAVPVAGLSRLLDFAPRMVVFAGLSGLRGTDRRLLVEAGVRTGRRLKDVWAVTASAEGPALLRDEMEEHRLGLPPSHPWASAGARIRARRHDDKRGLDVELLMEDIHVLVRSRMEGVDSSAVEVHRGSEEHAVQLPPEDEGLAIVTIDDDQVHATRHALLYPSRESRAAQFLSQLRRAYQEGDALRVAVNMAEADDEVAAFRQASRLFEQSWARFMETASGAGTDVSEHLDHLLLPVPVDSPDSHAAASLSSAQRLVGSYRRSLSTAGGRLAAERLFTAMDERRQQIQQQRQKTSLDGGAREEGSSGVPTTVAGGKTLLFYATLGIYDPSDAWERLPRQLTLLRALADLQIPELALRYRLMTHEDRPGVLEAAFEVIAELDRSDADPTLVRGLREGFGEAIHSAFAGTYSMRFVPGARRSRDSRELWLETEAEVEIARALDDHGRPLPFQGVPDWGHLIDYMRSLDRPTAVEFACQAAEPVQAPRAAAAAVPPAATTVESGPAILRALALSEAEDHRRLAMRITIGGQEGIPPGMAQVVASEIGGTARARVLPLKASMAGVASSDERLFAPSEALMVFHPPIGVFYRSHGFRQSSLRMPTDFHDFPFNGVRLGAAEERHPKGDTRVDVRLGTTDRLRHMYVVGKTGTGKTNLLKQLASQDVALPHHGVTILDPHGDLAAHVLNAVPKGRRGDVTLIDLSRRELVPVLNPLSMIEKAPARRDRLIQELVDLFRHRFHHEFTGPRFEEMVRLGLHTVLSETYPLEPSLVEMPRLFTDEPFQKRVIAGLEDGALRERWAFHRRMRNDRDYATTIDWLVSKFDGVLNDAYLRTAVGGSGSTIDFAEILDNRGILVVNLSGANVGTEGAHFLGSLVLLSLRMALYERLGDERQESHFVYIDEFQNFTTANVDVLVAEARKFGIGFVLAHQNLEQLRDFSAFTGRPIEQLIGAVLGNVASLVVFGVGAFDSPILGRQLQVDPDDLMRIGRFQALARLTVDGRELAPFVLTTDEALPVLSPRGVDEIDQTMRSRGLLRDSLEVLDEVNRRVEVWLDEAAAPKDAVSPQPGSVKRRASRHRQSPDQLRVLLEGAFKNENAPRTASQMRARLGDTLVREGGHYLSGEATDLEIGQIWGDLVGPFYTVERVAELIGEPTGTVRVMAREGMILELVVVEGDVLYPAWQFNAKGVVPTLSRIMKLFHDFEIDPWLTASWLAAPDLGLEEESPADWLRAGRDAERVLAMAESALDSMRVIAGVADSRTSGGRKKRGGAHG